MNSDPLPISDIFSSELTVTTMKLLDKEPENRPKINDVLNLSSIQKKVFKIKIRFRNLRAKTFICIRLQKFC